MKIWLNGRLVKNESNKTAGVFDSMRVELELQKGVNDILIKLDNNRGQNWFANAISLSFSDIKDARFNLFELLQ
jgi:mevalonate pyrophosphate decarboxylase